MDKNYTRLLNYSADPALSFHIWALNLDYTFRNLNLRRRTLKNIIAQYHYLGLKRGRAPHQKETMDKIRRLNSQKAISKKRLSMEKSDLQTVPKEQMYGSM